MKPINLIVVSNSVERFQRAIFDACASFILIIAASVFTALAYNSLYMMGGGVIMLCSIVVIGFLVALLCQSWWKLQYVPFMIIRPFRRDIVAFVIPLIGLLIGTLPFYNYIAGERAVSRLLVALHPLTPLFYCFGGACFVGIRFAVRSLRAKKSSE